jgi:hypothetical protein
MTSANGRARTLADVVLLPDTHEVIANEDDGASRSRVSSRAQPLQGEHPVRPYDRTWLRYVRDEFSYSKVLARPPSSHQTRPETRMTTEIRTTPSTMTAEAVVFGTLSEQGMQTMTEGGVEFVLCASALTAQM